MFEEGLGVSAGVGKLVAEASQADCPFTGKQFDDFLTDALKGLGEVVPSVVELRGGGPVSELSQTVIAATSGAAVVMVV